MGRQKDGSKNKAAVTQTSSWRLQKELKSPLSKEGKISVINLALTGTGPCIQSELPDSAHGTIL